MSKKPGGLTARHQGQGRVFVEDEEEYHARARSGEQMSSHMLAVFARCPKEWQMRVAGAIEDKPSPAYELGRAAHKMILEGQAAYFETYTVGDGPANPKTGKPYGQESQKWQEWAASLPGAVIGKAEHEAVCAMAASVIEHPAAGPLITAGKPEMVALAEVEGVPCQCRVDWLRDDGLIVDLKTCADINQFERDALWKYGYARQLAFYWLTLEAAGVKPKGAHIVAVDKGPLHLCGVWKVAAALLEREKDEARRQLRRFKECQENNQWPTGWEGERELGKEPEQDGEW